MMGEEELQEQIITQIEVLVEELGGTMSHLTKCDYTGSRVKLYKLNTTSKMTKYYKMYTFIKMKAPDNIMDILLISCMFLVVIAFAKYVGI